MFKRVQKMHILRNNVIIAFDGEYSDFTCICEELDRILYDCIFRCECLEMSLVSWTTIR